MTVPVGPINWSSPKVPTTVVSVRNVQIWWRGGGIDARSSEHRIGSRKTGPAQKIKSIDQINQGISILVDTRIHDLATDAWLYANDHRVGPTEYGDYRATIRDCLAV
jgi:hypothetical protein